MKTELSGKFFMPMSWYYRIRNILFQTWASVTLAYISKWYIQFLRLRLAFRGRAVIVSRLVSRVPWGGSGRRVKSLQKRVRRERDSVILGEMIGAAKTGAPSSQGFKYTFEKRIRKRNEETRYWSSSLTFFSPHLVQRGSDKPPRCIETRTVNIITAP